jgi:hypothetical protein
MRLPGSVLIAASGESISSHPHTQELHEMKSITIRALAEVRKGRSFNLDLATAWAGLGKSFDHWRRSGAERHQGKQTMLARTDTRL